jgi:large subunit ribosomal protein L20
MARVKRGFKARRRRNRILKVAKGYQGRRATLYKTARMAVYKGWTYAYRDRKAVKRDYRALWIVRINAASRALGVKYSEFIALLDRAGVELDRKVLADLAIHDPAGFARIVEQVRAA